MRLLFQLQRSFARRDFSLLPCHTWMGADAGSASPPPLAGGGRGEGSKRDNDHASNKRLALLVCLFVSFGLPASAQVRTVQLAPPSSQFAIRTYGVGFLPVDSTFTSFQGTLTYNPSNHATCEATFTAAVASLVTSSTAVRDIVVGPEFLDAMHFPSLRYIGRCDGSGLSGTLTMRGSTRPFRLKLTWDPHQVTAQGTLSRKEWGMTAKPFLVGDTVRIRVTTNLP